MAMEHISADIQEVSAKVKAIFEGLGLSCEDAETVTDSLIDAEISGVTSHGLTRLKPYADRILKGSIAARPTIRFEENGVAIQVDGGNGLGQVIMDKTVARCIALAKKQGVAFATVCSSNHYGTAAYYTNRIAKSGCIGFSATNAGANMAPFGGMDLLLGTNPFSVAFPAEHQIFCADMATSAVAKGKIRIYEKEGKDIPMGWALDASGNDTCSAADAVKGILLPMGGHKGYGLAMAVDMACGLLSGANLSCESPSMFQTDIPSNVGHCVCAIDIAHFLPLAEFEKRAQEWFDKIKASKPRPGMKIMIPGEPEARKRMESNGKMTVLSETMDTIEEYFAKYGQKEETKKQ